MALRELVARNIRALRLEKGLSQKNLAEAAGMTVRYLSAIENDAENVSTDLLERLAKGLRVTPAALVSTPRRELPAEMSPADLLDEVTRLAQLAKAAWDLGTTTGKRPRLVRTKKE